MLFSRNIFGERIGEVALSWFLEEFELLLLISILKPMIFHINVFSPFFFDGTIYKTLCCSVIHLYWYWWLRIAHFDKCLSNYRCILSILKALAISHSVVEETMFLGIL